MGKINLGHDQSPPADCSKDADEIVLNYAFASPSGGNLSPLPLTISKRLSEAPSASLRSIIIDALGIEGIAVKLGDVRFWRTKIPLESKIAANSIKTWIQQLPIGERAPEVIPFTDSISEALGEYFSNKRLVHLIVTSGDTPFSVESELLSSELFPGPPQASTPTIVFGQYELGYYPGRKDWTEVKEGERHSKDIELVLNGYSSSSEYGDMGDTMARIPSVLLGIKSFCTIAPNHEVHIMAHVSNIHSKGFRVHLDAFGRTVLYDGRLAWMAISPFHHLRSSYGCDFMQWGTVDSQSSHPRKVGRRSATVRVPFRQPYQLTPTVFSCLSGFTIGGSASTHWDIRTFVTGVDPNGFNLRIEKARDSEQDVNDVFAHALVSWISIPGKTMAGRAATCGEFYLEDGVRTEKDNGETVEWRGKSKFIKEFTSPPRVFVAFKSFDLTKSTFARIGVEIEKTTTEGIEWKVYTWAGTIGYSASMAFFAVGDI